MFARMKLCPRCLSCMAPGGLGLTVKRWWRQCCSANLQRNSLSVRLCINLHSERKMARAINISLDRSKMHGRLSAYIDPEVKRSVSQPYQMHSQHGSAVQYDCLHLIVNACGWWWYRLILLQCLVLWRIHNATYRNLLIECLLCLKKYTIGLL